MPAEGCEYPSDLFDELDEGWLRRKPGAKWHRVEPDVLPAWVADMDYPTPKSVCQALHELIDGADLGYPDWPDGTPLRAAFAQRMHKRFGWSPDPGRVREINDLVQGVQLALHFGTDTGDVIAVHTPSYPPCLRSITGMSRQVLPIPMIDEPEGWVFDVQRLQRDLHRVHCRALLLVNPHNPTGRVFTHDELRALADLADRHDLLVISDEIHADLAYQPHRHIPFASLSADAAGRTITLASASKAFNLAGTRCAVAHVGSDRLLTTWDQQPSQLYGAVNVLGVTATLAAWQDGDQWLAAALHHLNQQRHLLADTLSRQLPHARHHQPEATYLAWIDFRPLHLGPDPAHTLLHRGLIALSSGPKFGPGGEGFARLNFATSRDLLIQLLDRVTSAATAQASQTR